MGKETPAPNISDLHAKFCGLIKNNIIGRIKELGGDDDTTENPDEFRPVEVDIKVFFRGVHIMLCLLSLTWLPGNQPGCGEKRREYEGRAGQGRDVEAEN